MGIRASAFGVVVTVCWTAALANPPGLFGTGVDNSGAPIAPGAPDPHYTNMTTAAPAVAIAYDGYYFPASSTSRWVWQTAEGTPESVEIVFRTTFVLSAAEVATTSIHGLWATDNVGLNITINNVSTGHECLGFGGWTPFTVNTGFVAGVNNLDFLVRDVGFIGALRVDFLGGGLQRCGQADLGRQGGVAGYDGLLDNNDFIVFVDLFFGHDAVADMGSQGGAVGADQAWDNNDFVVFIDRFFGGC